MQRFLLILSVLGGCASACVNVVDPGGATQQQGTEQPWTSQNGSLPGPGVLNDEFAGDSDDASEGPGEQAEEPGEQAEEPIPGDEDGDGVVHVGNPGPPPAEAQQSCAHWTDCAPYFDDPNSGFDCELNVCTCDRTGQWSRACADIGGSWSSFECFCFTNTDTLMPTAAPETPEQAEDGVVCWWTWRRRYCDPDQWVDTSYYEEVCYSEDECYWEYVEDGYYIDGRCYGRWIKRCTDGNEYWY